jgi:hypothetical protein
VAKKMHFIQLECTLAELGIKLMVTKSLQDNTKMLLMLFLILGVDQDVFNEDHDKLVQLRHEYGVHQVHKVCRSIGESKRHNQILIQFIPGGEGSLRDVFQTDLDLMVTRMEIDLREDLRTGMLIKKDVDAGHHVLVLDSDSIQGPIINTQPQGLIFLLYKQC